jgi:hypothetical protein
VRYQAIGMVLGVLACDGSGDSGVERPLEAAPPQALVVLTDRDLDAYADGTRMKIHLLRQVLRSKDPLSQTALDSVGAKGAGTSPERFHELTRAVETALKNHTVLERGALLDSLRIELLLLRVRTDGIP